DPRVVLEAIADRLGMLVACDNLCIDVHDRRTGRLRPLVARGVHAQLWMAAVGPDTEGVGGWVVRHGQAQLVPDELADPRVRCFPELGPLAGSLMVVPLHGRDGIAGVLSLERLGSGRTFSDEEFELVQLFAAHASIAMQNAEAHRAVEIRAETDALTRLGNHGAFQDRLAWQVGQGERFSLVMLDLDNFKDYNDTFGHPAGDELLRELGHALRRSVRDNDNVYRYGGDEFTLLLPGTDPDGAKAVAEKIRQAVHDVHTGAGRQRQRRLACSLGLATFPDDGTEAESILLAADRAAYVSKRSGRDRITTAAEGRSLGEDFLPGAPTPVDEPGVAYGTA
ncbi:MAG TPA: sensor domain-containing diguanylate cyclase, partial [Candidatus Limnocylindrales bacterium]|nr:sensor domain-containing diguanylate cyclase [Candidatus Limnocylindrales bacterium]